MSDAIVQVEETGPHTQEQEAVAARDYLARERDILVSNLEQGKQRRDEIIAQLDAKEAETKRMIKELEQELDAAEKAVTQTQAGGGK